MDTNNVVKVLVLDQDRKVLILRRTETDNYAPGRLDFPGGGVDEDEDFAAAASRELNEEAGLNIAPGALKLIYSGTILDTAINKSVNRLFFACIAKSQEVKLSSEHKDYMWLSIDEALEMFPHWFYSQAIRYAVENKLLPQ